MNKQLEETNKVFTMRRDIRAYGKGNGAYFRAQRERHSDRAELSFSQPSSYQRLGTAAVVPTTGPLGIAPAATSAFATPTSDVSAAASISTTDALSDSITQLSKWQRQQRQQWENFNHEDQPPRSMADPGTPQSGTP